VKVWGLSCLQCQDIAYEIGAEPYNARWEGLACALRVLPVSSRAKYARRTAEGRRIRALCYHGFRDFITLCFERGATRVKSTAGDWRSLDQFRADLPGLAQLNIGSQMYPVKMIERCACKEVS
jgi:hypothetical protein